MIDFRIRDTGASLDLFPKTVVSMEINNPLFNTDALTGTFTYPLDIPLTDKNRRGLGYPESMLNRIVASPNINIDFYIKGVLFKSGIFKIINITDKITCSFIAGVGGVNDSVKGKKFIDFDFGRVNLPVSSSLGLQLIKYNSLPHSPKYLNITLHVTYAGVVTTITKANISTTNTHDDILQLASRFNADIAGLAANHIVTVTTDINESVDPNYYRIAFELASGASAYFTSSNSWNIVPSAFMDTKAAFLKTVAQQSYPDIAFNFFPIKNEGFYNSSNPDYKGYINYYDIANNKFAINTTVDGNRSSYSIIPFIYLSYAIKTLFSNISYQVKPSFIEDEEIKKTCIYNNVALDSILFDPSNTDLIVINKWSDFFEIKNHLPDMLITDFLKFVRSFFCLGYFIDDSKKTIELVLLRDVIESADYDDFTSITNILKEVDLNDGLGYILKLPDSNDQYLKDNIKDLSLFTLKDPVENTSDLNSLTDQEEKDVRYVTSIDEYWTFIQTYNGTTITKIWQKFSENYYDYKVGDGGNIIDLNANTLLMIKETVLDSSESWIIPITNETGSSAEFDLGKNNNSELRFLFYRGMQAGSLGHNYPLGTNGYKNYSNTVIGSLSFKLNDPLYGMNKKIFRSWLNFLSSTKTSIAISLFELPDLMDENLLKRKKRIDNVTYIINKINVNITMNSINPATVQYYKV